MLDGETGPVRDAVLLNAAAALVALDAGAAGSLIEQLRGALRGPPSRSTPARPRGHAPLDRPTAGAARLRPPHRSGLAASSNETVGSG